MDQDQTQAEQQPTEPVENGSEEAQEEAFAATCNRPECKCLHEYGLVAMRNGDGSVSQIRKADAKAQLESLKQVEEFINE